MSLNDTSNHHRFVSKEACQGFETRHRVCLILDLACSITFSSKKKSMLGLKKPFARKTAVLPPRDSSLFGTSKH
jgi:hypothetical protein